MNKVYSSVLFLSLCAAFPASSTLAQTAQEKILLHQYDFNLPALPLSEALIDFALLTEINIIVDESLLEGKRSRPLIGRYTPDQALQRILKRSDLDYSFDESTQTFAIHKIVTQSPSAAPIETAAAIKSEREGLEEIIVKGLRGSLKTATDIKKDASGIVDAIVAIDIRKFPDTNLAEAVQRIPGVSIDRTFNNEGSKVTVRGFGPDFNLVTLNGRPMPTSEISGQFDSVDANASRSFDFSNLASENIALVEVYKTSQAQRPSGGIGSTIDLRTLKPLDQQNMELSFGLKATGDTSNTETEITPEFSGLFSKKLAGDSIGLLITGSYQNRKSRVQESQISNWYLVESELYFDKLAHDLPENIWLPFEQSNIITDTKQTRINTQAALQFQPSPRWTISFDYADFKLESKSRFSDNNIPVGISPQDINPETLLVSEEGTALRFDEKNPYFIADNAFLVTTGDLNFINHLQSPGANIQFTPTESLTLELDAYFAESHSKPAEEFNSLYVTFGVPYVAGRSFDGSREIPASEIEFTDGINKAHLAEHLDAYTGTYEIKDMKSSFDSVSLHGEWVTSSNFSLQFGLSQSINKIASKFAFNNFIETSGLFTKSPELFPDELFSQQTSDKLFDQFSGGPPSGNSFYRIDLDRFLNEYETYASNFPDASDPNANEPIMWDPNIGDFILDEEEHNIVEVTQALFTQLTFQGDFSHWSLDAVIGMRYENTDVHSYSYYYVPTGLIWRTESWEIEYDDYLNRVSQNSSYQELLPNLDLKATLAEQWVARFSASRTLTRSDLLLMRPITEVARFPAPGLRNASRGNTSLKPFSSINLDLGLEWYYGNSSFLSVNYFRKELDNFIAFVTHEESLSFETADGEPVLLTDPFYSNAANQGREDLIAMGEDPKAENLYIYLTGGEYVDIYSDPSDPPAAWQVTEPTNAEKTAITGWEFSMQHLFGESGWGLSFNYTQVESDTDFDKASTDFQFAIPGISDSLNFVGFYEKHNLQARIAYNWRDEFLNSLNKNSNFYSVDEIDPRTRPQYTEAYGQWDFNVGYLLSDQFTIFIEGINVTSENQRIFARYSNQLISAKQFGSIYNLGLDYKF